MEKPSVNEIVIVEGRDDTRAVLNAIDVRTIETHGFGITRETWNLIEKAYNTKGIIIFTDPDHSGEEIRRRIKEKYPLAKEAFLTVNEATKKGDIGIENAKESDIVHAIMNAHCTIVNREDIFSLDDLMRYNLIGDRKRRESLGMRLGIGYANSKTFLKKLNSFGISREDFLREVEKL